MSDLTPEQIAEGRRLRALATEQPMATEPFTEWSWGHADALLTAAEKVPELEAEVERLRGHSHDRPSQLVHRDIHASEVRRAETAEARVAELRADLRALAPLEEGLQWMAKQRSLSEDWEGKAKRMAARAQELIDTIPQATRERLAGMKDDGKE